MARPRKPTANTPVAVSAALEGEVISGMERPPEKPRHPIAVVLEKFLDTVDDYRTALLIGLPAIGNDQIKKMNAIERSISRFVVESSKEGWRTLRATSAHEAKEMIDAAEAHERLANAKPLDIAAKAFFIGLFSEYDHFIGELLKAIYQTKPDLYKGIRREISLTDLLEFSNIDDIKRDMLEKEIDSFRRDGYIEQFASLERMFEIRTLRTFSEWPTFVEMAQRRNVLTHNGGCVSQQYLQICAKENVKHSTVPSIGDQLPLEPSYLADTMLILGKVGFMLAHTLWRKISPGDVNTANDEMNTSLYRLLSHKRWRVALAFGNFCLTDPMKRNIRDIDLRIRIINCAVALKKLKKDAEMKDLLQSLDWSACLREFSLARLVLEDRYLEAAEVMENIGKEGELISELAYHTWPLFDDFRGTDQFQEAYKNIYAKPFVTKVQERSEVQAADGKVKGTTESKSKKRRATTEQRAERPRRKRIVN